MQCLLNRGCLLYGAPIKGGSTVHTYSMHTDTLCSIHTIYMCTIVHVHNIVSVALQAESSPIKNFLDYFSLPNDDRTRLGLRKVAAISLSHLDRIAEPYLHLEEVSCVYMYMYMYIVCEVS